MLVPRASISLRWHDESEMFTVHKEEPQLHDMQSLNRAAANLPILPSKESEGPHHCSGM